MPNLRRFTEEEIILLNANPNVYYVTPYKIVYTYEFKVAALEASKNGIKSPRIFENAGFSIDLLGIQRVYRTLMTFKEEANSEGGLKRPKGRNKHDDADNFSKMQLEKEDTEKAIKELQERIVHLEQVLDVLKKTQKL